MAYVIETFLLWIDIFTEEKKNLQAITIHVVAWRRCANSSAAADLGQAWAEEEGDAGCGHQAAENIPEEVWHLHILRGMFRIGTFVFGATPAVI